MAVRSRKTYFKDIRIDGLIMAENVERNKGRHWSPDSLKVKLRSSISNMLSSKVQYVCKW